jgi:hypothetical protein
VSQFKDPSSPSLTRCLCLSLLRSLLLLSCCCSSSCSSPTCPHSLFLSLLLSCPSTLSSSAAVAIREGEEQDDDHNLLEECSLSDNKSHFMLTYDSDGYEHHILTSTDEEAAKLIKRLLTISIRVSPFTSQAPSLPPFPPLPSLLFPEAPPSPPSLLDMYHPLSPLLCSVLE